MRPSSARFGLAAAAFAALLGGCAPRYEVRVDHDPAADFAAYRSFAIAPRPRVDTPNEFDNSLTLKRVEAMIVRGLEGRGLARAEPGASDLVVRFWLTAEKRTDVSTIPSSPFIGPWPAPYPYVGRWGAMYDEVIVRNWVEGTLVLDLVDARRDELVWRAYVVGSVHRDRAAAWNDLEEAIARALAGFPPAAAGVPSDAR